MHRLVIAMVIFGLCLLSAPATARNGASATPGQSAADSPAKPKNKNEPAVLNADEVSSDDELGLLIARGHVEISQGGRTVRADTVTYNQKSRVIIATGNVQMFDSSQDVIFSDYAELTDDMRDAFVQNIRMILNDNSRVTGTEGERVGGRYTRMSHATYSPCYLCAEHPDDAPVWQIHGDKVVHDNVDKDVRYTNAVLDLLGVPVFYSPYLSHPDPTVKSRSGFLMPLAGNKTDLGFFFRDSYFFDINPDFDATLQTAYYSRQGPMLGGEMRKRFEEGSLQFSGNIIHAERFDRTTFTTGLQRETWRGFLRGSALFEANENWRWGGSLNMSSDSMFLRRYFNISDNILTSRAFAEGFYDRDYASIVAYRFQDLRPSHTQEAPLVAPIATYTVLGDPDSMAGGRWSFQTGLVGLTRRIGPDTLRLSVEPGWMRELVSDTGLVTTVSARVRADMWDFHNFLSSGQPAPTSSGDPNGDITRVLPQGQVRFSYPLVRNGESYQQMVEPIVALTAASRLSHKLLYPNEDSQDVVLDDTSLFSFNRFVGQDRQEGGERITYGIGNYWYGFNQGNASVFLGQDHRLSSDQPFPAGSGLDERLSDYVGHVTASPTSWLFLNYGFAVDSQNMAPRRQNASFSIGDPALAFTTSYIYNRDAVDPVDPSLLYRNEAVTLGLSSKLSRYWSGRFSLDEAMSRNPGPRYSSLILTYTDECLIFQAISRLDFTSINGSGPSQTIFFRFVFRNLGEVSTPGLGF